MMTLANVNELGALMSAGGKMAPYVLGGIILIAALLLGFKFFMQMKDKMKSVPFLAKLKEATAKTPGAVSDPAKRAKLDDLRKKFEEGVEKFRGSGKDIYSLPWYLLVGPSGSGKTEAMRHCKVGFPPGLQDCFQGAGGTLNMHWWFTNYAVVLDTAGRMFMEESALQGGSEWREFLKLMKVARPNAPINGMLLVIGIDSLIKDTNEQIESKAGHIAKQLDTIQRMLDVRFPVYVVITKCDLIAGFRDFFDKIDDPQLQQQILGWSNPASLDEAFKADTVDQHIKTIRERLMRRRATLLLDPVHTEDPQARRVDQVDELFSLPDNIAKIAPRLRRYLEIIFQQGEWSPKPLFLRGIYMTSSMRQGQALDEDLAAAMGVPIDQIPGGRVWDEERSFFLRDIFMSKAFREKGLVTRATNVQREQQGRRRLILGTGIGIAAAMLGLTFWSAMGLSRSIEGPFSFWSSILANTESENKLGVVYNNQSGKRAYRGAEKEVQIGTSSLSPIETLAQARLEKDRAISMGFFGLAGKAAGLTTAKDEAYDALVHLSLTKPLLAETRKLLASDVGWTDAASGQSISGDDLGRAVQAMSELAAIETYADKLAPARDAERAKAVKNELGKLDAGRLVRFLVPEAKDVTPDHVKQMNQAIEELLASQSGARVKEFNLAGTTGSKDTLQTSVGYLGKAWKESAGGRGSLRELGQIRDAAKSFAEAEGKVRSKADGDLRTKVPASFAEYNTYVKDYDVALKSMKDAVGTLQLKDRADRLEKIGSLKEADLLAEARRSLEAEQAEILGALPDDKEKFSDFRGWIAKAYKPAEDGLAAQVTTLAAALQGKDLLTVMGKAGGGRSDRGYDVMIAAHEAAGSALRETKPAAKWLETQDEILKLTGESGELGSARKTLETLVGLDVNKELRSVDAAKRTVAIAEGGRVGSLIDGFYAGISSGGKPLADLVKAEAAAGAGGSKIRVAMTSLDGSFSVSEAFDPGTAKKLVGAWSESARRLTEGKDKLVAGETLETTRRGLTTAMSTYADAYANAWASDVVSKRAQVREFKTWKEFTDEYTNNRPVSDAVHGTLGKLYKDVQEDLYALGESLGNSDLKEKAGKIAADRKAIEAVKTNEGTQGVITKANKSLGDLAALDSRAARTKLIELIRSGEVESLTNIFSQDAAAPVYWQSLVGKAIKTLADDYGRTAESSLESLRARLAFPLLAEVGATELSATDLKDLAAQIEGLGAGSLAEGDIKQLSSKEGFRDNVARLAVPDVIRRAPALSEFVKRARAIVDVLGSAEGSKLGVSVKIEKQDRPVPGCLPGATPARDVANKLRVVDSAKKDLATGVLRTDAESPAIDLGSSADGSFSFELISTAGGEQVVGSATFAGPWAAIRLIMTNPCACERSPDGKSWLVPLTIDAGGGKRILWVRVELRKGLPAVDQWPKRDQLGG